MYLARTEQHSARKHDGPARPSCRHRQRRHPCHRRGQPSTVVAGIVDAGAGAKTICSSGLQLSPPALPRRGRNTRQAYFRTAIQLQHVADHRSIARGSVFSTVTGATIWAPNLSICKTPARRQVRAAQSGGEKPMKFSIRDEPPAWPAPAQVCRASKSKRPPRMRHTRPAAMARRSGPDNREIDLPATGSASRSRPRWPVSCSDGFTRNSSARATGSRGRLCW